MKAIKIKLAGRDCYLAFTGEAMFRIRDEYTGTAELLDAIKADTQEGYRTACAVAALLAEQGELARRHFGYDPEPMVSAEAIMRTTAPCEIATLKLAIPAAIALGYGREIVDENAEIDLGLAELSQKKTT